jgi:hypothetical protein
MREDFGFSFTLADAATASTIDDDSVSLSLPIFQRQRRPIIAYKKSHTFSLVLLRHSTRSIDT